MVFHITAPSFDLGEIATLLEDNDILTLRQAAQFDKIVPPPCIELPLAVKEQVQALLTANMHSGSPYAYTQWYSADGAFADR